MTSEGRSTLILSLVVGVFVGLGYFLFLLSFQ